MAAEGALDVLATFRGAVLRVGRARAPSPAGVEGLGLTIGEGVGVGTMVGVGAGVAVGLGVRVGVAVGVAVGLRVGVAVGVTVGLGVGVGVGEGVRVGVSCTAGRPGPRRKSSIWGFFSGNFKFAVRNLPAPSRVARR